MTVQAYRLRPKRYDYQVDL